MKRVRLDRANDKVKDFIRSLIANPDGSILVLEGRPVLKIVPVPDELVDPEKVKEAIRTRRAESRALNREWEAVDREMWDRIADPEE